MKKMKLWMLAAILVSICGVWTVNSCSNDSPASVSPTDDRSLPTGSNGFQSRNRVPRFAFKRYIFFYVDSVCFLDEFLRHL